MGKDGEGSEKRSKSDFDIRVSILKRKLESAAREISAIVLQGRKVAKEGTQKTLFLGMYKCIEKYFSKYENTFEELSEIFIEAGNPDFPSKEDSTSFENTRRYYYEAHSIYESLSVSPSGSKGASPLESTIKVDTCIPSSAHLPKLAIPTFNGEFTGWPRFRDSFKSIIHDDSTLSDITKYHYLVTSLGPVASAVINHLPLLEENYLIAWNALLAAYDNKRMLAATYLNMILDSPPLSNNPSIESLTEFLSKITENVSAFRLLRIPKESDFILYFLAFRCLDRRSREQFEIQFKDTPYPTFDDLSHFIREHCRALQLARMHSLKVDPSSSTHNEKRSQNNNSFRKASSPKTSLFTETSKGVKKSVENKTYPCFICTKLHKILDCPQFMAADSSQRRNQLKGFTGCFNCLGSHPTKSCASPRSCRFCFLRHHSMLHYHNNAPSKNSSNQLRSQTEFSSRKPPPTTPSSSGPSQNPVNLSVNSASGNTHGVLLGTAIVELKNKRGEGIPARIVLDSGSQCSFITSRLVKKLGLPIAQVKQNLNGIGQTPFSHILGKTVCTLTPSNRNHPILKTEALVIETITSDLPNFSIPAEWIEPYLSYDLADPTFWKRGEIEALIGADLFCQVLSGVSLKVKPGGPVLISSQFGYLVMGTVPKSQSYGETTSLVVSSNTPNVILDDLKKFWELEETFDNSTSFINQDPSEEYFLQTHSRNAEGRYIIRLPFTHQIAEFENSAAIAMKRFLNMENKLKKNPDLCRQYAEFMKEYQELGHMSIASSPSRFVLPHHSVMKDGKIRVVFDASASTPQGSLNQHLEVGPKLQKDIRIVILNFRKHKAVFVTDIVKMYRQILIHDSDTPFQHIYWRSDPAEAINKFELKTLTYGMSCAPYLAQRVIKQLCIDEGHNFPLAAQAINNDIYIDDLVTGAKSLPEALELQQQTIRLLERGGFKLSKWSSNYHELIPEGSGEIRPRSLNPEGDEDVKIKILGLQWNPKVDTFGYKIISPNVPDTKRGLLSAVARIYDPLGWLAPTVIIAKRLIQELWKANLSWDETVPPEIESSWRTLVRELPDLAQISIPRRIIPDSSKSAQIIGFCDASMMAYSATLYLKTLEPAQEIHLLTARTKVAPLKTISIPRLELCGALLLSRTYVSIKTFLEDIGLPLINPVFFTDSQVVLSWLNHEPYSLKTFVANRVTEITSAIPSEQWCHVSSNDNPSDISSRGLFPNQLLKCKLWWNGPPWLTQDPSHWPISHDLCSKSELPELKSHEKTSLHTVHPSSPLIEWMERISSYKKIIRTLGWVHRFIDVSSKKKGYKSGPLTLKEINVGLYSCVKAVQSHYFFERKEADERQIPTAFSNLSPFLDEHGILRVGGRLSRSNLSESSKHPILIPKDSHFTKVLVDHYHVIHLHPGPAFLQALIQRKYWIPSLRRITRQRTFLCMKCFKAKAANKTLTPIMSDLPEARVQKVRPFLRTGVDFAGPFQMRHSLLRKPVISKIYLCVFVCMATKALHLEAVSDLSTNAFLACLSRFVARRGFPQQMFSDCGTNFTGASNYLKELIKWWKIDKNQEAISTYAANHGFKWTFNAPYGPHQGGLWEAAVKSAKTIIRKTAGDTPLTYEEWSTLFVKIESILNSRPLCPPSTSPEENDYLSPGHFLIGDHLITPPERSLSETPMNRLKRWQLVQKMFEDFWKRWSLEYLTTLQTRSKWKTNVKNVKVGDLLLLREENSPPLHWPMGRVSEVLPGKGGVIRVVKIQVGSSEHLRPVQKLVPLKPLEVSPFSD